MTQRRLLGRGSETQPEIPIFLGLCLSLKSLDMAWVSTLVGLLIVGACYLFWMWRGVLELTEREAIRELVKSKLFAREVE